MSFFSHLNSSTVPLTTSSPKTSTGSSEVKSGALSTYQFEDSVYYTTERSLCPPSFLSRQSRLLFRLTADEIASLKASGSRLSIVLVAGRFFSHDKKIALEYPQGFGMTVNHSKQVSSKVCC